jgi:acyl dehydratase
MGVGVGRHRELQRTITLSDMVAYAGATWDWHRLHYDSEYAQAHGMRAPVVDGQMLGALMAMQGTGEAGADRWMVELAMQLRSPVFAGDTVTLRIAPGEASARERIRLVHTVLVDDRVAAEGYSEFAAIDAATDTKGGSA